MYAAVDNEAVCGYLVAALEHYHVADNYFGYRQTDDIVTSVHLAAYDRGLLLKLTESVFVLMLRESGHEHCDQYGGGYSDGFIPFGVADARKIVQKNKYHVQEQRNTEYLYHRISEVAEQLMEEALTLLLRQAVAAVFFS